MRAIRTLAEFFDVTEAEVLKRLKKEAKEKESAPSTSEPSVSVPASNPQDYPPKRQGRAVRGVSDVGITQGRMFGSAPILGGHKYGIFDNPTPILGRTRRITGRPVLSGGPPVVGSRGRAVTQSSVVGDGGEVSDRIWRRRRV